MSPDNAWFRFFLFLLGAAIAVRLVVDLIRPTIPYLAGGLVLYAVFVVVRWWRAGS